MLITRLIVGAGSAALMGLSAYCVNGPFAAMLVCGGAFTIGFIVGMICVNRGLA